MRRKKKEKKDEGEKKKEKEKKREISRRMVALLVSKIKHGRRDLGASLLTCETIFIYLLLSFII